MDPGYRGLASKDCVLEDSKQWLTPKDSKFGVALHYLFDSGNENADKVESNLEAALQFVEDNGVPNANILPRTPPVYVIAALQDELADVHETDRSKAIKLLTVYLWRSFFSDRYAIQANDRLYEDFKCLREDLRRIRQKKAVKKDAPLFIDAPVITEDALCDQTFTSRTSLGNAIIALTLHHHSKDWVTGEELTTGQVRRFERENKLDRHHVFPRKALTDGKNGLDKKDPYINHGLNLVLLRKSANITLGSKDPVLYLNDLKNKANLTDTVLKNRIESHFVPYDSLMGDTGTVTDLYKEYRKARARKLWKKVEKIINCDDAIQEKPHTDEND